MNFKGSKMLAACKRQSECCSIKHLFFSQLRCTNEIIPEAQWEPLNMCLKAASKTVYLSLTCLAFTNHMKHESVCLKNNPFRYEIMFECLEIKVAFKTIYVEVNKKYSCKSVASFSVCQVCFCFAFDLAVSTPHFFCVLALLNISFN